MKILRRTVPSEICNHQANQTAWHQPKGLPRTILRSRAELELIHSVSDDVSRSDRVLENRLIEAVHLPGAWSNHRPACRSIDAPLSQPIKPSEIVSDGRRPGKVGASATTRTPAPACRGYCTMARRKPAIARGDHNG